MTIPIPFSSIRREAQNKHRAPFAGFPIPGRAPVSMRRKLLAAAIEGLETAECFIESTGDGEPHLTIVAPRRRYRFWSHALGERMVHEQAKFAARKRAGLAKRNGWKRGIELVDATNPNVTYTYDSEPVEGELGLDLEQFERREFWLKNGLKVAGSKVLHAASGKSVAVLEKREQAFVAAERILKEFPDWTQDAESVIAMVRAAGACKIRNIEREVLAA